MINRLLHYFKFNHFYAYTPYLTFPQGGRHRYGSFPPLGEIRKGVNIYIYKPL